MKYCVLILFVLFCNAVWRPLMVTDCTLPSAMPMLPDFECVSWLQDHHGLPFHAAPVRSCGAEAPARAVADELLKDQEGVPLEVVLFWLPMLESPDRMICGSVSVPSPLMK